MKRFIKIAAVAAIVYALCVSPTFAQVIGGAGGGMGDQILQWFYSNFIRPLASAGVLFLFIMLLFMRSHFLMFIGAIIALLCIANYQAIVGLFGI